MLTQQVPGRRKVGARYEQRSAGEFEDGQNRADRTDAEIAISGVKGGGVRLQGAKMTMAASALPGSAAGAPAGFRAVGACERLSTVEAR